MYPPKTSMVYSTLTPRGSRIPGIDKVVVAGQQMFVKRLKEYFHKSFFKVPLIKIEGHFQRIIKHTLGVAPDTKPIRDLHKLGYLPLHIKSLPEGTVVPMRTPVSTIHSTHDDFFWLTNRLETLMSAELWKPSTSATIAWYLYNLFRNYALETTGSEEFCKFQGHDFSMRGMAGVESAVQSGLGHLMSFVGTDTIPAILAAEEYYDANVETELVGCSVLATEHSIQCAYGDDLKYLDRLISVVHPTGLVSIVSDGYDYWNVLTNVLPQLKDKIMARNGKVVIRPDSGDPVKIVCGDPDAAPGTPEHKGSIEVLWEIFGGTVNSKGFKELDPHIGLIYGDAITFDRAHQILEGLKARGFASTNIVFGVGSFTYQYNTRDSLGYAIKSTNVVIDGKEKAIFKNPKTDDGTKISQKGCVSVFRNANGYEWIDGRSIHNTHTGDLLRTIFLDGATDNMETFAQIRARLKEHG